MPISLPRITARIDTETRELFRHAATIEKARHIMACERSLKLSQEDAMLLVKALDEDVSSNPRLKQAANRYSDKKQTKHENCCFR